MSYREMVPKPAHPDRMLFEEARHKGNELLVATLSIDQAVEHLHRSATTTLDTPDFTDAVDELKEYATETLALDLTHHSETTWTDFYRLYGYRELLDEILYTPIIYRHGIDTTHQTTRELLADGVCGVSVQIMESALEHYEHPDAHTMEKEWLRGVINEHTAMALLNYEQSSYTIALPARTRLDIHKKTDVVQYQLKENGYSDLKIQIKSRPIPNIEDTAPKGGIYLTGTEMGNGIHDDFTTARALVHQVNGVASDRDMHHITIFHAHTQKLVRQRQRDVQRGTRIAQSSSYSYLAA